MNAYERMREALANFTRYEESDIRQLEGIGKRMMNSSMYGGGIIYAIAGSIREAKAVVDATPRNCDVGTAEEQMLRYGDFCHKYRTQETCCENCPANGKADCELVWAQMPYEQKEGGAK